MSETDLSEHKLVPSSEQQKYQSQVLGMLRLLADPRAWRMRERRDMMKEATLATLATGVSKEELYIESYMVWEVDIRYNVRKDDKPPWEVFTELLDLVREENYV